MALINISRHGSLVLADIASDEVEDWDTVGATNIRVSLPVGIENMVWMQNRGFQFVDRILDVTINLSGTKMHYEKMVRLQPVLVSDQRAEIKRIAQTSFINDRRFYVKLTCDRCSANRIISDWVDDIESFYVCQYKGRVIGFLALKQTQDGKGASIHLAAVDERYRMTGAAMSLYANAVIEGIKLGYKRIEGCISSSNVAVINLYSYLGGTFSNPKDVYLKEVQNE